MTSTQPAQPSTYAICIAQNSAGPHTEIGLYRDGVLDSARHICRTDNELRHIWSMFEESHPAAKMATLEAKDGLPLIMLSPNEIIAMVKQNAAMRHDLETTAGLWALDHQPANEPDAFQITHPSLGKPAAQPEATATGSDGADGDAGMATTAQPNTLAASIARRISTGPALFKLLKEHGIEANTITRNRRTGVYTVKFAAPNMSNFYAAGTDSYRVWAERIESVIPDAEFVADQCYDSAAEWRPSQPILFATVTLRIPEYVQVAA
jgi:hypothetical protein